ncbi:MAG TPA: hypothetical protein VMP01_11875 [Pirellulaceae bacterium]|nr:hypothetical protein [Pirellulaceae bacterium]
MVCRILALLMIAGFSLGSASVADAQHFSFSVGHGHHHHGWRHGWHYDHCWYDPWYWGPDYVYVVPPRPRVVYVEPAREVRVQREETLAMNEPKWSAAPASTRSASTKTLQIWNASGQRIPVSFLVDAKEIELADGQSHSLHGEKQRVVEFDRGGTFGTTRYALTDGQYEFVITDRGWDLVRKQSAAGGISLKPIVKRNSLPGESVAR